MIFSIYQLPYGAFRHLEQNEYRQIGKTLSVGANLSLHGLDEAKDNGRIIDAEVQEIFLITGREVNMQGKISFEKNRKMLGLSLFDKIFTFLTIAILVISVSLIILSGLDYFINFHDMWPVGSVQTYAGFFLLGVSVILAILHVRLSRHALYEFWIVVMIGGIVGAIYAF